MTVRKTLNLAPSAAILTRISPLKRPLPRPVELNLWASSTNMKRGGRDYGSLRNLASKMRLRSMPKMASTAFEKAREKASLLCSAMARGYASADVGVGKDG